MTTAEIKELARLVRQDRARHGMSVEVYAREVLNPFLDGERSYLGTLDRSRCRATTYLRGMPWRQCLRAAGDGGLCFYHARTVGQIRGSEMNQIKRVILESPYAGDVEGNEAYARRCARDCAMKGESSQASHLYYTQFLDDNKPEERALGMRLGLAWREVADYSVFYTDRGWSRGMLAALHTAINNGLPFKVRALDGEPCPPSSLCEDMERVIRSALEPA